jgi:hypothetical protein
MPTGLVFQNWFYKTFAIYMHHNLLSLVMFNRTACFPIHIYYQCWIIHFIGCVSSKNVPPLPLSQLIPSHIKLVLLWAQLTKIYPPPLPTSVQPISITKTSRIVPTKNERDPPLFTDKLLIKFQNILRNTTQVIIRHRVKILFSVISSPITLEQQKWK